MWQSLRLTQKTSPDFASSAKELGQQTSSKLVLTVGFVYLIWHLVATLIWPGGVGWQVWYISPLMLLTSVAAWRLIPRHYLLAQVVWLTGLFLSITLALIVFQEPRLAYLYALLPLVAVITVSWQASVLIEGFIFGALWWLGQMTQLVPLSITEMTLVLLGGAFTCALGWAASDSLLMVAYWSLSSYVQARDMTEEAQRNRGQLARVLRDLDQAYYRLQRANAALVVAWRAAAEAERFKAEFATSISHELRTPLNLIVGFSEMMMTSPESYGATVLPGTYRRDLNSIYNSAQHLLALVDDVIDLARIDAGKIALAREEVDLAVLVREATNMVHDYILAKGLDMEVHIASDMPRLWLDRLRIRQVFLNLLVNAARFTKKGGISVEVSMVGDEVLVSVKDTGQGISAQELPRIFDEFRPHEDTSESPWAWHSGSGLGLPISKRFIEMHHGRMGVESVYEHGTTIWFTLPCENQPVPAARDGETDHPPAPGAASLRAGSLPSYPLPRQHSDERIIIAVSDDPYLPHFLQRHIDGYRVVSTATLADSVALIEDLKPVAVLADGASEMPLLLPDDTPVIHCPLPSTMRAAQAMGVRELLNKPVSREELLAAIDRLGSPVQRVLIVDDDPDMVRMFQRMLSPRIPLEACLAAYSGTEALSVLQDERPDLVLLDMVMPEMDGHEVIRRMGLDPALAGIPIFVVSAQAQAGLEDQLTGAISITRVRGFRLSEEMQMLEAILSALGSDWGVSAAK
jgi:signal transduction histidine kinase/CheY-like chemotaxis protein